MTCADSESTSASDDDKPSGTSSNGANTTGSATTAKYWVNAQNCHHCYYYLPLSSDNADTSLPTVNTTSSGTTTTANSTTGTSTTGSTTANIPWLQMMAQMSQQIPAQVSTNSYRNSLDNILGTEIISGTTAAATTHCCFTRYWPATDAKCRENVSVTVTGTTINGFS